MPNSSTLAPEVAGILELQRTVGNRAVTAAAAAGALPRYVELQRSGGAVQREWDRETGDATHNDRHREMALTIVHGLDNALRRAGLHHLPDAEGDMWISIIDVYIRTDPQADVIGLFSNTENLYQLLAPWGFVGPTVYYDPTRLVSTRTQAIGSLMDAIARWKAEDPKARKKSRAKIHSTMGAYDRSRGAAEVAHEDAQVLAGPNRADPSDAWGPDYTGTREARRDERERIKNQHALDMIEGIKNQGPGGLAGMVTGRIVGMLPGMDAQKSTETGMAVGSMADALIMTHAEAGGMGGGGGGYQVDQIGEMAGPRQEMERPDHPSGGGGGRGSGGGAGASGAGGSRPGDTQLGMGAAGPAGMGAKPTQLGMGAAGPAGIGARPREGAGYLDEASPGAVIAAFRRNPFNVKKSGSDAMHRRIWVMELRNSGKWAPGSGPAPEPPMAFHRKNGVLQVNEQAWFETRGTLDEILQPHEKTGERSPGGSGGAGGGATGGKRGDTQIGYTGGAETAVPKPAEVGKTQIGVPPGPGGVQPTWKAPEGPPPVPPGNTVRKASHEEVKELFAKDPYSVVIADSVELHQYIWEYSNWRDGKRVTNDAPAAFWLPHNQVRVDAELWKKEGGDIAEILMPQSQGRQANEFESAKTLPGGNGGVGGSTAVTGALGGKR